MKRVEPRNHVGTYEKLRPPLRGNNSSKLASPGLSLCIGGATMHYETGIFYDPEERSPLPAMATRNHPSPPTVTVVKYRASLIKRKPRFRTTSTDREISPSLPLAPMVRELAASCTRRAVTSIRRKRKCRIGARVVYRFLSIKFVPS